MKFISIVSTILLFHSNASNFYGMYKFALLPFIPRM